MARINLPNLLVRLAQLGRGMLRFSATGALDNSLIDLGPMVVMRIRSQPRQGRITYVSANVESMFGIDAGVLLEQGARRLLDGIYPSDRLMVSRLIREVAVGRGGEVRARILRPDGRDRWARISAKPLHHKSGEGQFHFVDISDEIREATGLRERLHWTRDLLDRAPIGIASIDPWQRTYVNPTFANMFHLNAPDRSTPDDWWASVHPDDAAVMRQRWGTQVGRLTDDEAEFRVLQPDGSVRWVLGRAVPRLNSRGEVAGVISSVMDIHDLTLARQALNHALRQMSVLIEHLPVTIYRKQVTSEEQRFHFVGGEFLAQFGLSAPKFRYFSEMGLLRLIQGMDIPPVADVWSDLSRMGESIRRREYVRPDGTSRWFEFRERVIAENDHRLEVKGIVLDVTADEIQRRQLTVAQKRYQDLVESLPVGVFEDWQNNSAPFVNHQWLTLCGMSIEDMGKDGWLAFVHPDDREAVTRQWHRATSARVPFTSEFRLVGRQGRTSWMLVHAVPTFAPNGHFQSYIGTGTDVTRIKQLDRQLRETVTHLQATIGNLPGAVFRVQQSPTRFRLLYVSEGAEKVIGVTAERAMAMNGEQQYALLHAEELEPEYDIAEELLANGQSWRRECITRPDGQQYWADIRCTLIETQGDMLTYEGLILDVTEEVEAKQQLEKQEHERQKLERQMFEATKLDSLGRLAGGIAHDFNNLLGAILGYAQFVEEDAGDNQLVHDHAGRILAAADRGKVLVEQILAFARQSDSERKLFSLDDLVRETEALVHVAVPKAIDFRVSLAGEAMQIRADRGQIGQVVMNLCMNARDSLASGVGCVTLRTQVLPPLDPWMIHMSEGQEVSTTLGAELTENGQVLAKAGMIDPSRAYLKLTVEDNGIGMDLGLARQVFEPFFTTKPQGKGTGLGLSVVHGIVMGHQGAIIMETTPGVGTAMHVLLPGYDKVAAEHVQSAVAEPWVTAGSVMVVDDDHDFGDMLTTLLQRKGWSVDYFNDPLAALEALERAPTHWNLVVTDQAMPGIRGSDLIQKILRLSPDLPCVLCSGYDESLDDQAAQRIGAAAFVRKPLAAQALLDALTLVLKKRQSAA